MFCFHFHTDSTGWCHNGATQQLHGKQMKDFGQRLYVSGIGVGTTEDDLRALIYKYTHHDAVSVSRVDLDTDLPAYVIEFEGLKDGEVQQIAARINDMYWHGQSIAAHVI